ncbi:MAG: 50S ribosomal protein L11 [Firmicutes bacterium]|nr:50S ribosomal protein L11 [Bacillota bacterium]
MSKPIKAQVKLQIEAGKATPAPPVGSTLGPHGINIPMFVKGFNDATAKDAGLIIPVVVTIYGDRSFDFEIKTPPTAVLIKKELGLASGSKKPNTDKVGKITRAQIEAIAKMKMVDMNAASLEAAMRMVEGAARSMGVVVVDA